MCQIELNLKKMSARIYRKKNVTKILNQTTKQKASNSNKMLIIILKYNISQRNRNKKYLFVSHTQIYTMIFNSNYLLFIFVFYYRHKMYSF